MKVVLVTGVSGAGKTTAVHALEDLDFYCVDNLPMPLVQRFVELLSGRADVKRAALVTDARSGEFLAGASGVLSQLRHAGHDVEVLFLDAPDVVLLRRFSETRRRHPLSGTDIRAGLQEERRRLEELRQEATSVIDTGTLTVHMLRALVLEHYSESDGRLALSFLSFGFKHGLPVEADIVLDVRFLPNPFFVEALSALSGQDEDVRRFVLERDEAKIFLDRTKALLAVCLRGFIREGKSYATVAIGCTGGRHRSVAMVEELCRHFSREGGEVEGLGAVTVRHRDMSKS
ncbi:MAG: RNase adapter RapZ [Myxococcales bacterium]|nr:RNase adapter RapZ [Myxococcales bacterium]